MVFGFSYHLKNKNYEKTVFNLKNKYIIIMSKIKAEENISER